MLSTYLTRARILATKETETIHTRVFDIVQGIPWPPSYPGRALANDFTRRWHEHESELSHDEEARRAFQRAKQAEDYSTALLYAGQSVGMLDRVEPAATIARRIASDAEALLRAAGRLTS